MPNTGDQVAEIELPLNLLVVGDLKGVREETSIEERQVVSVNKNNFNSVMNEANISLSFNVPNRLEGDGEEDMPVALSIKGLDDFSPDNVAKKVPELKNSGTTGSVSGIERAIGEYPSFPLSSTGFAWQ